MTVQRLGPTDTCPACSQVRGYFHDAPGQCPGAAPVERTATVTPIRPRREAEGIHPYAEAIRRAWLERLDQLARTPWRHGDAWDTNCFVSARKLIEVANSAWSGYSLAAARDDYFTHAPHDSVWDGREKCWEQAVEYAGADDLPEPAPLADIPAATVLRGEEQAPAAPAPDLTADEEASFWAARPILTHLHQFARARRVSPWAVLGVTLARIVTATPHQVCLPPIVGGRASLNLFVGIVGRSGSGKGASEAVAGDAVHVGHITTHNVGSGEGIAHGYMRRTREGLDWIDDTHAVLFSVPEIDSLAAQGLDRKGATLMPQLRSGWTGEQLGFGYADPTKRIIVPAHEYRLCLVAGIQPARAACLLDDADGGTPQRFLWLPATDPTAPDVPPEEPAPMSWQPPPLGQLVAIGGAKVKVCQTARDTIVGARLAGLRGDGEALDGHALLAQLKTAAALALADGRLEVLDEDWALAGVVAAKSAATRAGVVQTLAAKAAQMNRGRADAEAARAVHVAEEVAESAVKRVCRSITRKLAREGDWTSLGAIKTAAGRERAHVPEAIERLLEAGQIEVEETEKTVKYRLSGGAK